MKLTPHPENPHRITSLRFRAALGATPLPVDPAILASAEFPATKARDAANHSLPQQPACWRSMPDRTETVRRQPAARNPASPLAHAIQTLIRCDIPRDHSRESRIYTEKLCQQSTARVRQVRPSATFNLRQVRLADRFPKLLAHRLGDFLLGHGSAKATQRAFNSAQVTNFVRQSHRLDLITFRNLLISYCNISCQAKSDRRTPTSTSLNTSMI